MLPAKHKSSNKMKTKRPATNIKTKMAKQENFCPLDPALELNFFFFVYHERLKMDI